MLSVLLVIQVIVAVFLIGMILIQRNSSDGVSGLGGGSSNSLFTSKASANILTRITSVLAFIFMANCLAMATISARRTSTTNDFLDSQATSKSAVPSKTDSTNSQSKPSKVIDDKNSKSNKPASAPLAD